MTFTIMLLGVMACSEQTVGKRNQAPVADITSHTDSSEFSTGSVVFSGQVSDLNHNLSALRVNWYVNNQIECEFRIPNDAGRSSCAIELNRESATIRMEVRDPDDEYGDDAINITVVDPLPPLAQIHSPLTDVRYTVEELIVFEAYVDDPDGAVEDMIITWRSDRDGDLDQLPSTADSIGKVEGATTLSQGEHRIDLIAIDSDGLQTMESTVIHVDPENSPPECSIISPADQTEAYDDDLIVLKANASDPDTDPSTLIVEWESNVDGLLGSLSPDSTGLSQLPISGLSVGPHLISAKAIDDKGASCVDQLILNILSGDGAPSAPEIDIDPSEPLTEFDDLTCRITQESEDPEGELINYIFTWQKDGQAWSGTTLSDTYIGDGIPATETLSGQTWTCQVVASDGFNQSPPAQSSVTTMACADYRDANTPHTYGVFTDNRDGQNYRTLQIGTLVWMVDNLNVGQQINSGNLSANNGQIEKYCIDDNPIRCAEFGGLYSRGESIDWIDPVSANGTQGICPNGWRIATKSDYESILGLAPQNSDLIDFCEGGGFGVDTLGYGAKMAGKLNFGQFTDQGQQAIFWTSTWSGGQFSHHLPIFNNTSSPSPFGSGLDPLNTALSIRCVQD